MEKYLYIFDIPVYRCSEKQFFNELDRAIDKRKYDVISLTGGSLESIPHTSRIIEGNMKRIFGGPWNFNQVIGWLRLFAEHNHVGGHLWWVNKKRIHRFISNKKFYLVTPSDILGNIYSEGDSSDRIFKGILSDIKSLKNEPPVKNRFFDLELFLNVGPYIDWRALISQ